MSSVSIQGVDIEWLGHASVKIRDSDGFLVYVDPWSEVMKGDYEEADLIISTHNHFDHFDKKMIQQLKNRDTSLICTEESESNVPKGLEYRVIEPNRSVKVKSHKFRGVHAYNIDKFREPDTPYHPRGFCTGVIFEMGGLKFYHMSDTDPIPELEDINGIDVAFVPVGGKYTMDQEEAIEAIMMFEPDKVVPIHYGHIEETEADREKLERSIRLETDSEPIMLYY